MWEQASSQSLVVPKNAVKRIIDRTEAERNSDRDQKAAAIDCLATSTLREGSHYSAAT
jgi:hypothetical protein